jgi:hypothetical protein
VIGFGISRQFNLQYFINLAHIAWNCALCGVMYEVKYISIVTLNSTIVVALSKGVAVAMISFTLSCRVGVED